MPAWLGTTRDDEARYDGAIPATSAACRQMRRRANLLALERLAAGAAERARRHRRAGDIAAAERCARELAALRALAHRG